MWSPQGWTACREHSSEEVHPAKACHVRPPLVTASHDTVERPSAAAVPLKPAHTPAPMPELKPTPDWAAKWRAACTLPPLPEQKCTRSNSASVRRDGSDSSSGSSSGALGTAGELAAAAGVPAHTAAAAALPRCRLKQTSGGCIEQLTWMHELQAGCVGLQHASHGLQGGRIEQLTTEGRLYLL